MPYATRDAQGRIVSLHRSPSERALEFVDTSSAEVLAFLGQPAGPPSFGVLDADFVRVLEDLVWLLVDKGIVQVGELPLAAQAKLLARNEHRLGLATQALSATGPASGFVEVIDDSAFGALPPLDDRPA